MQFGLHVVALIMIAITLVFVVLIYVNSHKEGFESRTCLPGSVLFESNYQLPIMGVDECPPGTKRCPSRTINCDGQCKSDGSYGTCIPEGLPCGSVHCSESAL
jgi:hypothetical protein